MVHAIEGTMLLKKIAGEMKQMAFFFFTQTIIIVRIFALCTMLRGYSLSNHFLKRLWTVYKGGEEGQGRE